MSATELPKLKEDIFVSEDKRPEARLLLRNTKKELPDLVKLSEECDGNWGCEDAVYRFYHQSFKVYNLQTLTLQIVAKLKSLLPAYELNEWFNLIVHESTGKKFKMDDNNAWLEVTRPI